MERRLAAMAVAQGGVFTAAQARACGYTDDEITRRRRSGTWVAVRQGIYATAPIEAVDPLRRHRLEVAGGILAVAHGRHAGAVAAGTSAAVLWDLDQRRLKLSTVELTTPAPGRPRAYPGLVVRPAGLPRTHRARLSGVPLTSVARTVVDIARRIPFADGVVVADSALRRHLATVEQFGQVLGHCAGWPGSAAAARVVAFADPRAESVAESLARTVFAELGLPAPQLQARIRDADGSVIARVDFLFWGWVVVEIDGRIKYDSDPEALWKEKRREDRLRAAGFEVVRIVWADLLNPERVRAAILAARTRSRAA